MASGDSSKPPRSRLARRRPGQRHGNRDHTKLNVPTQHELGGRYTVTASELRRSGSSASPVPRPRGLQLSVTIPSSSCTARSSTRGKNGCIFDLIDGGNYTGRIDNRIQMLRREVRDTNGSQQALCLHLDERFPGIHETAQAAAVAR